MDATSEYRIVSKMNGMAITMLASSTPSRLKTLVKKSNSTISPLVVQYK